MDDDDDEGFLVGGPDSEKRLVGLGIRDLGSVPDPVLTLLVVIIKKLLLRHWRKPIPQWRRFTWLVEKLELSVIVKTAGAWQCSSSK
jgi:hypothetical protein